MNVVHRNVMTGTRNVMDARSFVETGAIQVTTGQKTLEVIDLGP
jgi:hypothetical protein